MSGDQQAGIFLILATNADPRLHAADLHKTHFGNPMGAENVQFGGDLALMKYSLDEYYR
jgi:hypothetical protein